MRKLLDPKLLALVAALGLVAQSEWMLALAVGWPVYVAWLAPVALDAYVIHAVRIRQDLGPAVIISAVSVFASHAVYAAPSAWDGDHLRWYFAALCSVVPLLVAWRVHHLHQDDTGGSASRVADGLASTPSYHSVPAEAPTAPPEPIQAPKPPAQRPKLANGKAQATDEDLEQVVRPLVRAGKGRPTIQKALKDAGLTCETTKLANLIASLKDEPLTVS
jgi:hypothetical protein